MIGQLNFEELVFDFFFFLVGKRLENNKDYRVSNGGKE